MRARLPAIAACVALGALATPPLVAAGCSTSNAAPTPVDQGPCTALFGRPNAMTGLDSTQCQPECVCNGVDFAPPAYDAGFIDALTTAWTLELPYAPLTSDPYAGATPTPSPDGTVCAVMPGDASEKPRPYTLRTFSSQDEALANGGEVTHFGACGVCSPLTDLAVYMKNDDLVAPVQQCGVSSPDVASDVACLEALGFDEPCADAWAYDTAHTRSVCLTICTTSTVSTYNTPDGGLSPCLQCDEDQSGPVFQAVAGRTRRNSGLPNAICRPCSEVQPLVHAYH